MRPERDLRVGAASWTTGSTGSDTAEAQRSAVRPEVSSPYGVDLQRTLRRGRYPGSR